VSESRPLKILSAAGVIPIEGAPLFPGAVLIEGETIRALGDPKKLRMEFPDAVSEDHPDSILLPGLVNAHADLSLSHFNPASSDAFKMSDGRMLLMPWLIQLSRYKSKLAIAEQQGAVAYGLQMMKSRGVTTLGDRCRYPAVLSQYRASGLRVVCLAEVENIQRPLAQEEFEQALALVDEIVHEAHPRLKAGYAPFAAYTLSKNLLKILAEHALNQGLPLHLFAALSFSEMEFFYDSEGEISAVLFREAGWAEKIPPPHRMTPVQFLHEIGFLRAHPALAGCLHLGPTDDALLNHAGAIRVFAPKAFHYLQLGEIPWNKILENNTEWALATLGKAWGSTMDPWDEMRLVLNEFEGNARETIAQNLLRAATLGAAKALGLSKEIGSLIPGKKADFILVAKSEGDEFSFADLIDQTRDNAIQAVYVSGKKI
jgi:5-methylthioadenosine/S-adenosylhomocysteine deaminase